MEKLLNKISFKYSDPEIASILNGIQESTAEYSMNFNQNEESFVKCGRNFRVPSFAVHHDVSKQKPSDDYLDALRFIMEELVGIFPDIFSGTRYYFDPAEIFRPCFIQIFRIEESYYLYMLRLDLNIRLSECIINSAATNDMTADYSSSRLYFDSLIIPIYKPDIKTSGGDIPINRLFSSTWIGETGTGYHIGGQWIDREISKFISAVFLPEKIKSYPFYPFICDFNTVCLTLPDLSPNGRKRFLNYMHKSLPMINSDIGKIETEFRTEKFSKTSPIYHEFRKKVPVEWTNFWSSLKISPYLNENEMKEYLLEFRFP